MPLELGVCAAAFGRRGDAYLPAVAVAADDRGAGSARRHAQLDADGPLHKGASHRVCTATNHRGTVPFTRADNERGARGCLASQAAPPPHWSISSRDAAPRTHKKRRTGPTGTVPIASTSVVEMEYCRGQPPKQPSAARRQLEAHGAGCSGDSPPAGVSGSAAKRRHDGVVRVDALFERAPDRAQDLRHPRLADAEHPADLRPLHVFDVQEHEDGLLSLAQ